VLGKNVLEFVKAMEKDLAEHPNMSRAAR
jgi:hypothetical protein